ncbi:MAG: MerR family transcriptional regulator [Alphaproteobacteria bacterium]|nr:MerR family transcriptional regulator [Alphaproteobacteria bacterium]
MFDPDKLYTTDDPALRMLAPASTLAQWRYEKRGPAYMKYGKRIMYCGKDLNAFLAAHRVEPLNAA